jgi:hypothetical protein
MGVSTFISGYIQCYPVFRGYTVMGQNPGYPNIGGEWMIAPKYV